MAHLPVLACRDNGERVAVDADMVSLTFYRDVRTSRPDRDSQLRRDLDSTGGIA